MKSCLCFICLLFCIPSVLLGQDRKQNSFFFVQLTDPQLGFYSQDGDFSREQEQMHVLIETINVLKPEFVVISGDLVHDKENEAVRTYEQRTTIRYQVSEISAFYPDCW